MKYYHGSSSNSMEDEGEILAYHNRQQINPRKRFPKGKEKSHRRKDKLYTLIWGKNEPNLRHKMTLISSIILYILTNNHLEARNVVDNRNPLTAGTDVLSMQSGTSGTTSYSETWLRFQSQNRWRQRPKKLWPNFSITTTDTWENYFISTPDS